MEKPGPQFKTCQIEASDYLQGMRVLVVTVSLMAVVLMLALDKYILVRSPKYSIEVLLTRAATAVPTITTQFNSLGDVGRYSFQPAFGQLFSGISVKLSFTAAISIFELGSIICATAQSSFVLVVGCLIAGAAAA